MRASASPRRCLLGLAALLVVTALARQMGVWLEPRDARWVVRHWAELPRGAALAVRGAPTPSARHEACTADAVCEPPSFVRFGPPVVGYTQLARAFRHVGWTEVTVDAAAVGEAALPRADLLLVRPKGPGELELGAEWLAPGSTVNRIRETSCIGGGKAKQAHCRQTFAASRCRCTGTATAATARLSARLSAAASLAVDGKPLQPRQWRLSVPEECWDFFATTDHIARNGGAAEWILKPSGAFHGRGIETHSDAIELRRRFGAVSTQSAHQVRVVSIPSLTDWS